MTVADAVLRFAARNREKVQLLRPFAVFSAKAYSTPLAMPIGIAYVAALLESAGYSVDVVDGIGEGIQNVRRSESGKFKYQGLSTEKIIARIDPACRLLGVSLMFSQDWVHHRDLITAIKAEYPDLAIVVGGEHATALPELVLRDCPSIDSCLSG